MRNTDHASLSEDERMVLTRFVELLRERVDGALHAVWLFGSRARGSAVDAHSDIDVLVITDDAGWDATAVVYDVLHEAARDAGRPDTAWAFSLHVHDPGWVRQRRAVESFFIAAVDRDRIDLTPSA